jgi:hypothetical protein
LNAKIHLVLLSAICASAQNPADLFAGKKKLLAIGDVRTGFQHDSVSHALATIERLGYESGAYVTFIRTDSQLITKSKIERHDPRTPSLGADIKAKNLDYFDAIFFMGTGEGDLSDQQKKDLLAFVHDDGKGFVAAHTGDDAYFTWPNSAKWWAAISTIIRGACSTRRSSWRTRNSRP